MGLTDSPHLGKPRTVGTTFGPGREVVPCLGCGVVVLVPHGDEPNWPEIHEPVCPGA